MLFYIFYDDDGFDVVFNFKITNDNISPDIYAK